MIALLYPQRLKPKLETLCKKIQVEGMRAVVEDYEGPTTGRKMARLRVEDPAGDDTLAYILQRVSPEDE